MLVNLTQSMLRLAAAAGLWLFAVGAAHGAVPEPIAIFDVELWDTTGEGHEAAYAERLQALSRLARDRFRESQQYRVVDVTPVSPSIERNRPLFRCGGCQLAIAKQAGAGLALNVIVRRMSTLVQEISVILADVRSDEIVASHSVSIRNDSLEAWQRGLLYILDNRLLPETAARHDGDGSAIVEP
ncbi:DUF3280 domain-containing protein [Rhodospirillaceae bacterium SYSU D60014]|uniref:DUF3280 domain-containing protein n=1 Tax=Virgifigura deserti TaxID=2268457 RepID=UPI0013C40158